MNKKAYSSVIVDVYATIIIIVLIIVFFAAFNMYGKSMKLGINTKIAAADSHILLTNYLKYQLEYAGQTISFADFFDRIDPEEEMATFERIFEQSSYDYFIAFHKLSGCRIQVTVNIDGDENSWELPKKDEGYCEKYKTSYLAEQQVPSMNGKTIIVKIEGGVI